jgi:branched-chain amino acid transport system permease protein
MATAPVESGVHPESYRAFAAWWPGPLVRAQVAFLGILVFALPLYAPPGGLWMATGVLYTALAALGVQVLVGYSGQATLGHAALVALGAYATTLGVTEARLPFPVAVALACIAAALVSFLIGWPLARVGGLWQAAPTLIAQLLIAGLLLPRYGHLVGRGTATAPLPRGSVAIAGWPVEGPVPVYYLTVVLTALGLTLVANLLRTRIGRAWLAVRDDPVRAATLGIHADRARCQAFVAAGVLAGLAGGAWVAIAGRVRPEDFSFAWSLWLVLAVLVGGLGSLHGVVFGAFVIWGARLLFLDGPAPFSGPVMGAPGWSAFAREGVVALVLLAAIRYRPRGLAQGWARLRAYASAWPFAP